MGRRKMKELKNEYIKHQTLVQGDIGSKGTNLLQFLSIKNLSQSPTSFKLNECFPKRLATGRWSKWDNTPPFSKNIVPFPIE